jgi:fumarylacetoacetate (FAA) hydrolase
VPVKLCRFSLADDPRPRAGIFHDGKIYETDGEKAIGVHVPDSVQLLTPIGHAASLRIFDVSDPGVFKYGNPGAIAPPEYEILFPETDRAGCDVFLCAVIGSSDRETTHAEADALILGYTILLAFSIGDSRQTAKRYDPGYVLGPFVVTPDELEPKASATERGLALTLKTRLHLDGEIIANGNTETLPMTFAEMIREASIGADVREGDIIAAGPLLGLSLPEADRTLRDGDAVVAVIESLGALAATVRI